MLAGRYYDGRTSRAHRVHLSVQDGTALLEGEADRACPLDALRVSERSSHAARKVTFPDGATFEPEDQQAFLHLLEQTGHQDSAVVRAQSSWRIVIGALAAIVAALALGYFLVLPVVADHVAQALPPAAERQLGQGVLEFLDRRALSPSTLSPERRQRIADAFAGLHAPHDGAPPYRLLFRKSRLGPNAFALPSGDIVLTDELVKLLPDDGAVMGVLAHELGHLHRRHMTRRLMQGSAVAAASTLLFGDVSGVVAGLPALALDLHYSREAEEEADDYAAEMLVANGLSLSSLEQVFTVLGDLDKGNIAYLSTHPASAERLARLRARHGD
jgi:Zn-dependent protease with chaperone function